ncbi:MAG TPA: hypothetical protein VN711_03680 [Candidatus Saccharimonadales bacterium]|nr:hypothetical protein [Candidatus Saccharimonadales bacterium]
MASSIKAIREAMVRRRRRPEGSAGPRGESANSIPAGQGIPQGATVVSDEFITPEGFINFTAPGGSELWNGTSRGYVDRRGNPLTRGGLVPGMNPER